MFKLLGYVTLVYISFLSCNGSIKPDLAQAKEVLRKEDEGARKAYRESYQAAFHFSSDSGMQKMFFRLDSLIQIGAHYMDSMYNELSFLADHDPTNFQYPKTLFLYKGVGDTLFADLTKINNLAGTIAIQTGHRVTVDSLRLTVLNQATADAWKTQDFSALNPFAAMALLHDFSLETFQVGKACLPER